MRGKTFARPGIVLTTLIAVALACPAWSQLNSTDARLGSLRSCLPTQYRGDLDKLRNGLLWNWKPASATTLPEPPAAYLASLDLDIEVCKAAVKLGDAGAMNAAYSAVAKDIEIKTNDCRKFGMGRMVSVRVKTLFSGAPSNGWQVFYKWAGSSVLQGREIPFPNLTSPATGELPPGTYSIRVANQGAPTLAQGAAPVTIVVGLEPTTEVEIPVQ